MYLRVLLLAAAVAAAVNGATNTVTVTGLTDIWLAGQPAGTEVNGGFTYPDVVPANSPVLASTGLTLTPGSYLTVSATGSTNFEGCEGGDPDGSHCAPFSTAPFTGVTGMSSYSGRITALVGVFLNDNAPSGAAPAAYSNVVNAATISPQLNQVFFIGDGLTGTGTGTVQQIVVPAGATRLFLAASDGPGASYNNSGSFAVTISDASPSPTPAVPVPPTLVLALTGLLTAGGYYARRRSAA